MKTSSKKSGFILSATLALALLASGPLAADPPTTTFYLTGVGAGNVLAGVYTSPYSGSLTSPSPGTSIPVICDDFTDDSYVPEQWTAYITPVSSLGSGTDPFLRWSGSVTTGLNQTQAYTVAAVLAVDIMQSSGEAQEDYSYALWELFDSNAFTQLTNSGDGTDESNALTYLNNAVTYVTSGNNAAQVQADVQATTIYSYDSAAGPPSCNGGTCPHAPPQEFLIVNMAEPPSLAVFALYFLLGGCVLLFWGRHRNPRSDS